MAGDQIRALMTARVSDFLINVGGEEFTNPNFNIIRERLIAHMLKLGSLNSDTTEVIWVSNYSKLSKRHEQVPVVGGT